MKEERYRLIMVVGLYLGILLLLISIIVLVKNVEEIKMDPLLAGIELHNFDSCICFNSDGSSENFVSENLTNMGKAIKLLEDRLR